MSQTTRLEPPQPADPAKIAAQDAWVGAFIGIKVSRTAARAAPPVAAGRVSDFFSGVGHAIGDAASAVGHAVADAATTVAHKVEDAAVAVAHTVEDAASTVGTAASVAWHAVTQKPAVDCLKSLDRWLPLFAKIKPDNPVRRVSVALWARVHAAEKMSGLAKADELDKVADAASAADADAKDAYQAWLLVDQHFRDASETVNALPDPQKGAVIASRDKLLGDLEHAVATAATVGELRRALETLKGETASLQAQSIRLEDATKQVTDDLQQAKAAIDKLKDADQKSALTKQHDALAQRLADAPKAGDIGKQKAALFALGKDAVALLQQAMQAEFSAQAATKEGKQQIDAMIKGFGDVTHDPAKQAICKAAIAACYKVPLESPEGLEMTRLPALYNMMAMVPSKQLEGLKKIEYETDPTMLTSYYVDQKVVFNEIGAEGGTQAMENQADPKKTKNPDYFKMTALHELGHYVDDKNHVMDGGLGKPELGNWKNSNIGEIAEVFYNRSMKALVGGGKKPTKDDLVALLSQALATGGAKKPANAGGPLGSLFDDWDSIVANAAYLDCLQIRNADASPWNHMVDAGDGRAYHEGYAGYWYSYPVSERAKGISNYQFRAPAEWFAEQFAYFRMYSDKKPPASLAPYMTTS